MPDASLDTVLSKVPKPRLPDHPLVNKSPEVRLRHSRGQSLPDWLALRSGNIGIFPDAVAHPTTDEEVRSLLSFAKNTGAVVIPYGGGTSVVGHITPPGDGRPVLTMDMGRMNRLINFEPESRIATFGAGTAGPELEAQLRALGYTLGHFPQSFEFSTLGGWVATRSSGQQSLFYGRIEHMFAGGRMESPEGAMEIPTFPASSAGPDLREIVLGSEGRLGIMTQIKVRVQPLPEIERFYVLFFPDWETGIEAVRHAAQETTALSMVRLSNPAETETQLALSGHRSLTDLLGRYLSWRGAGDQRCMLTFGLTVSGTGYRRELNRIRSLFKQAYGGPIGRYLGRKWQENRFLVPYLRNSLWEKGYGVDTLETATDWQNVVLLVEAIESAMRRVSDRHDIPIHCFTHLSHLYPQGASIYTTFIFPAAQTYDETHRFWVELKHAASLAIVENGGTISHQHGVGTDHALYLSKEKGELGIRAIKALCRAFDPDGIMNPSKLAGD